MSLIRYRIDFDGMSGDEVREALAKLNNVSWNGVYTNAPITRGEMEFERGQTPESLSEYLGPELVKRLHRIP